LVYRRPTLKSFRENSKRLNFKQIGFEFKREGGREREREKERESGEREIKAFIGTYVFSSISFPS
jgi:hypothetical protein